LSDRDQDKLAPEDGEEELDEAASQPPSPATWAGRQLSSEEEPQEEELEEEESEEEPEADDLGDQAVGDDGEPPAETGAAVASPETVEANTPALADREAAREAALAGLRARTAEHAAKQAAAEAPAEARAQVEQAPPAPPTPPVETDAKQEPSRKGLWARFLAGSFLIMVSMATATAVSLLVYLTDFARGLGGLPSVRGELQAVDPGNPQTILILGSDQRPSDQTARSDTTLLVRVASDRITLMSIPRDLKVNIPGHGIGKFNEAYTYGGPKLTLKVAKQLTGLENINHVVNVDFNGFADAVDAIDCVYVDVDHHYYHSNVGLPASEQYAEIDIPAGYQRMCGYKALQYVRYRHEDNDLVRAARQQQFLREARQELPPSKLISDRNQLIDILKKYVTSDIESGPAVISLGRLFIAARNAPVLQIHFPANLGGPNAAYVTASASAIKQAVARFEGEAPAAPAQSQQPAKKKGGQSKKQGGGHPAPPPLDDVTAVAQQYTANLTGVKTKAGKPMLDFPVYYPTRLAPNSTLTDASRAFPIDGPGDSVYRGYKFVAELPTFGYTAYYGVSGTDWRDPPILANPDETKTIDGRDYLLSWDGGRLRLVGWKTDHGSYWVDNTLLNVLTPGQMVGIAESMRQYTG
jgi:LCP family protein required for cell wall assembly